MDEGDEAEGGEESMNQRAVARARRTKRRRTGSRGGSNVRDVNIAHLVFSTQCLVLVVGGLGRRGSSSPSGTAH